MADTAELPRRTIDELITRYTLEPSLKDIFVEGPLDKAIYSWYLANGGCHGVVVFEIGSIEVDEGTVAAHGFESGNRSRVIALALELDSRFPNTLAHVRCVADSDFDFILKSRRNARHLLYTDYTSVELYAYSQELLEKVLAFGFGLPQTDCSSLFGCLAPILQELFVLKAANQALSWGLNWIPFTRCCALNGAVIEFNRDDFVQRYLNTDQRLQEKNEFENKCEELRSVTLADPRHGIQGHDFITLVGWYLNQKLGRGSHGLGEQALTRAIILPAVDIYVLSSETLFVQLTAAYQ